MVIVVVIWCFFVITPLQNVLGETPKFRILAPEFICPKDDDTPIEKPDNTVITLQTAAGSNFDIVWTVRWSHLETPSQRFTLLLWKTIRDLEKKLNMAQPEPYVYVIPNDELLVGVDYIFNVTAMEPDGTFSSPKSFHIDNTQGDLKMDLVEGRADLLFVMLAGAQMTYANIEYVLEALVTSCFPTQDYHFLWAVYSTESDEAVYISPVNSSRLVIPPYTLRAGQQYDVNCQVIKHSTGERLTQTGLPFQVLFRGLKVYLSVDYLLVPVNQPFFVEPKVINPDYYDSPALFKWECSFDGTPCESPDSLDKDNLYFSAGLSELGEYEVKVIVSVADQMAEASTIIKTVEKTLPVLQIIPLPHLLNAGSKVSLIANASNVAPTCTLTWYFATEKFMETEATDVNGNNTCEGCQHGEPLSDTLTIFSLEENFLTELADFTNETEWRQVTGEMMAGAGRARIVAECGCSITFECTTKGMVYADMRFALNEIPKPRRVKLSPETGAAMETVFRISTLAMVDRDPPLRYSFYCKFGDEDNLLLGSFVEHLAVETFLPYAGSGGVDVWLEICDSLGACANGDPTTIVLAKGNGSTIDMIVADALGHIRRCEMLELMKDVGTGVVTYINAGQPDLLTKFTTAVLAALPPNAECLRLHSEEYAAFLHWLSTHGVDMSSRYNVKLG